MVRFGDTMPGVEARRRRPKFKEYTRVGDAQNFARDQLGVGQVDYESNLVIANVANHALFAAHARGVPMPRSIRVRPFTEEGDNENEMAYYDAGLLDAPGEIVLNANHRVWGNLTHIMRRARERNLLSTADPRHPIAHEMGEVAMHQSVGGDRFYPFGEEYLAEERAFRERVERGELRNVLAIVSRRAEMNHSEFVAEVFAALLLGREDLRANPAVMNAFQVFGGDSIVQWTE
jgi:hypothetical protein